MFLTHNCSWIFSYVIYLHVFFMPFPLKSIEQRAGLEWKKKVW